MSEEQTLDEDSLEQMFKEFQDKMQSRMDAVREKLKEASVLKNELTVEINKFEIGLEDKIPDDMQDYFYDLIADLNGEIDYIAAGTAWYNSSMNC